MSTYQVKTFKVEPGQGAVIVKALCYVASFDCMCCAMFQGTRLARAFCFVGPVTHWRR